MFHNWTNVNLLCHFGLSFKTGVDILLLVPLQRSVCWQTDFRANYVNRKHPVFKVKPPNQTSPSSISNNLHTNSKIFPEKKKKSHFPQGSVSQKTVWQNQSCTQSRCRYWQRCVDISNRSYRSLTSSFKYRDYMNQVLDFQPQIHHKIRNTLHT